MKIGVKSLKIFHENNAIVDIAFSVKNSLGIVGKSGSGKSLTLKALLNLLPNTMRREISLDSDFEFINGKTIAYVPQNPFTALSPMSKIKDQFFAPKEKQEKLLKDMNLEPALLDRFPAELSGGQLQRTIIATAIANDVKLLLLDEPTTALDTKSKNAVLEILKELKKTINIVFVSHDIKSVSDVCETICVLDRGRIVEENSSENLLRSPKSNEAKELINSDFSLRSFRE
ncbi:MAG: ATP-binding cassette domain-containing protein [Helicobacteraceae bacterium]|nr:ATP-binding cassette domain-containing protein [Helicobacteraceae bacterium]